MIKSLLISPSSKAIVGGTELIEQWQNDEQTTLWLDLDNVDLVEEKALLKQLNCHPLAIEDAQRERHPPKIELFDDYIYLLYRGIVAKDDGLRFEHLQISLFIGHRILITRHPQSSLAINTLFNVSSEKYLKRGPAHMAIRLFHCSCGFYLKELFTFEAELEKIEDKFLYSGNDKMMRQITSYRSQLVKIRRTFNYHVSIGETLKAYVEDTTFKKLGYNLKGTTEALVFDSNVRKDRNQYMHKQYAKKYVTNHSVGMIYVKMVTCINHEDYPVQKENYDKYAPMIVNQDALEGIKVFWAILEAKVIEGSAVPNGSNWITPTTSTKSVEEQEEEQISPSTKAMLKFLNIE